VTGIQRPRAAIGSPPPGLMIKPDDLPLSNNHQAWRRRDGRGRAHDPRLGRDVAIKICAERFSEYFEREARAVASLNHPCICTLYDVGSDYLVMELVEGPTLAERIQQGPIPAEESRAIARQNAHALEAAHERGIVHRDLKPANVSGSRRKAL
jgi:serine/threonine protein kinase